MHLLLTKRAFHLGSRDERHIVLVAMRQLRYNFFAYFSENFALVDTGEVIEKQYLAVVNSERAYYIFVQNVRAEVSRQFSAID